MGQRILGERVTHHDVRKAIQHFLEGGGTIERLPEQKPDQQVIGGEKYEVFESLTTMLPS